MTKIGTGTPGLLISLEEWRGRSSLDGLANDLLGVHFIWRLADVVSERSLPASAARRPSLYPLGTQRPVSAVLADLSRSWPDWDDLLGGARSNTPLHVRSVRFNSPLEIIADLPETLGALGALSAGVGTVAAVFKGILVVIREIRDWPVRDRLLEKRRIAADVELRELQVQELKARLLDRTEEGVDASEIRAQLRDLHLLLQRLVGEDAGASKTLELHLSAARQVVSEVGGAPLRSPWSSALVTAGLTELSTRPSGIPRIERVEVVE